MAQAAALPFPSAPTLPVMGESPVKPNPKISFPPELSLAAPVVDAPPE